MQILIAADGKVTDARVLTPSGHTDVDNAALRSARMSEYQAGTAFCKPAPGEYAFRAVFSAQ